MFYLIIKERTSYKTERKIAMPKMKNRLVMIMPVC